MLRKCYFPSEPDGHLERSWAIFSLDPLCLAHDAVTPIFVNSELGLRGSYSADMMLSYLITPPCFALGVPLRSSVVLASRL